MYDSYEQYLRRNREYKHAKWELRRELRHLIDPVLDWLTRALAKLGVK